MSMLIMGSYIAKDEIFHFPKGVKPMSKPMITMERFIEMLADHGLSAHAYTVDKHSASKGAYTDYLLDISKDDKLIETYKADIIAYFDEETAKEEIVKLAHPGYDKTVHGIVVKRDTQFAGFAELLFNEIVGMEDLDDVMPAIARRAYDLVKHTVAYADPKDLDALGFQEAVHRIPDKIAWLAGEDE